MFNHRTNFQIYQLSHLWDTSKQSKELRHLKPVWLNRTISNRNSPNAHVIANMNFVNCTLESCKLSKFQLVGCLVTNCKAVSSDLYRSLVSWHHLEKYGEWFFENCKFSNCILEHALVKNSELHRSKIELATTFFGHDRSASLFGPGFLFLIRRSYLRVCTVRSCSISRSIVAESQLSKACALDFVPIARYILDDQIIWQSPAI